MTIRAVFFDMGGTIETYGYTRALRLERTPALQAMLRSAGIDPGLDCEPLYEVVAAGLDRYHKWSVQSCRELSPKRVWSEYIFAGYPLDREKLDAAAEDLMCYIETQFYHREMRPEIPSVLENIRQMGLKIGLISNVNSLGQVPTNLAQYNIETYFNPIVLSSEYGVRKPDPAIFHHAARRIGVPASQCAYVGDRVTRDIDGARRAGFGLAVQIRHAFEHGECDDGAAPDAIIDSMTELLDILSSKITFPNNREDRNAVRAVLFDAGDILYERPERGRRFDSFLKQNGVNSMADHTAEKEALSQQAYRGEMDQDHYRAALVQMYGITQPEQIELGKQILDDEDNAVRFFDGVQATLVALKSQGVFLGIVTDTANSIQTKLRWFESGGFGHVWDSIISSQEVGVRKPDPRIYHAALEQLGISAGQALFVGHKATELDGARRVGMTTAAFNYEPEARADFYLEKFGDLLEVPILFGTNGAEKVNTR